MPIIQYLANNPELSALLALTIIGFTISYGAAFALGRIGVEIGFVLNVSPLMRRIFAIFIGGFVGFLVGATAGALVGMQYKLGPDHVLLGLISFLGLTMGTFLGGIRREVVSVEDPDIDQTIEAKDNVVEERIRWLVWHYTSLELGQAISLAIAIVVGAAWGMGIEFFCQATESLTTRMLYASLGAGGGAILGGAGALLANPQGRIITVATGMLLGLASCVAIGVLINKLGEQNEYFLIPGTVYGALGGFCFGLLGGDPVHAKPVD